MSVSINTYAASVKLDKAITNLKKDMAKENKALAKGLYIAMSNASIKKGKGKQPKIGSKKAENGDWVKGNELYAIYGKDKKKVPVVNWLKKLSEKNVVERYRAKNGKIRKRKVAEYRILKAGYQRKPTELKEYELWRKGSNGKLPYSWGGDGLADYYLRRRWAYSNPTPMEAQTMIGPAVFKNEDGKISEADNQRVLKLLDDGGTMKGSRHLVGYELFFTTKGMPPGVTGIIPAKIIEDAPTVRMKPFNLRRQVLTRVNRVLKKVKPSQITTQHWREIGKGY